MNKINDNQTSKNDHAVIYYRESTVENGENPSLEMQEKTCREYCENRGWKIESIFVDDGESENLDERLRFNQAVFYCYKYKGGDIYFLVYSPEQLTTNVVDFYLLQARLQEEYQVDLLSATPYIDGYTESELVESISEAVDKYESQSIGLRAKTGMTAARSRGQLTGPAPVGYLNSKDTDEEGITIIDPERGHLVSEAFEMFSTGGYSVKDVSDHINRLGFRSRVNSRAMTIPRLTGVLKNRIYVGDVFVNDEVGYVPSEFIPLVSRDVFDAVQKILRNREQLFAWDHQGGEVSTESPVRIACRGRYSNEQSTNNGIVISKS